jgi:hypothetical protein
MRKDTRFTSIVIDQCTRCFSLRTRDDRPCTVCEERLGVKTTATQPILMLPVSHEVRVTGLETTDCIPLFGGQA